ncbi:PREDICTED: pre-mRNA-processing factor 39 [Bactrocera latifrons]|uniref:Pre-mRNA-processing factor 39 n=3 Tax=Bactrocera latifrons TaxID=174628 RepID=A0A0K8VVE7_BACLA|nr:PREDICTED: pre-mRNA-processing factor 39 [Bactrocera latifrons]
MASKEDNVSDENLGRRTRSGRKVVAPPLNPTPARSTRRTKRNLQEQITEIDEELRQTNIEKEVNAIEHHSDVIKEMLEEAAQGVIIENPNEDGNDLVYQEQFVESEEIVEEVPQDDDCIVYEEQVIVEDHQQIDDDIEMFAVQEEEQVITEAPTITDTGIDEKSSSFPFGPTGGHSETSEDVQNEDGTNETGAVESSLLASLAGDNANSLPSVGGGEENDVKKEDFEAKVATVEANCEKMESEDSLSEPAIAEDIGNAAEGSDATIVNTELVSEDELPLPTKPEINDAEEVSDDELPAPKRAELPADAEVISEDELPTATLQAERKSPPLSPEASSKNTLLESTSKESVGQKRKADDGDKSDCKYDKQRKIEESKKRSEEQYNPMSPTSESNDATPISSVESKKNKTDVSSGENEHKERKKEKDREREKEKEKEKEKERKRLPDLDKYWRAVKEDPADFTGWTYLLQYVDNESDAEAAREAYDAFLSHYPYCYGYWRKYADYEKRKGIKANCNAVFERGLEAIPLSVDLWIHYLAHVKCNHAEDESYIRSQFERAIDACGLEFRSDKLWDAYIKWESESKHYQNVVKIYDRLLAIPTQGYSGHFDNFQDLINQHSILSTISTEELRKIRFELRESISSRSSSSRSKSRRSVSKDKEREKDRESRDEKKDDEVSSKSPNAKDAEFITEEIAAISNSDVLGDDRDTDVASHIDLGDVSNISEEEETTIKDKVISIRRKLHKATVAAVTARWTFEEGIKRPYFHVKPLERCQLKNWKDYLDFEIEKGDRTRILVLFERCLIACALYDEFWLKMIRYLETQLDQLGIVAITSDVYRRACEIHHPDKPSLHLMWAAFEECQNNFDRAAVVLQNLEKKCPNLLQVAYRRINVERRRGDMTKCRELYEHYINTAKNKTIAGSLAIKYARFLNKICDDLDGGLRILRQALEKDTANTRVALQMIDLVLQRPKVDEDEVVLIMDKFMARENMDPEQKVLFAQRKVEFLEDFGGTAKGLQDAQRALQLALSKANEAKKKRESSPSRKSSSNSKESSMSNSAISSAYNNGTSATTPSYNYNSANSAYYGQQNSGAYTTQQSYDGYYNHWQYGSNYGNYGQWSGYGNYY